MIKKFMALSGPQYLLNEFVNQYVAYTETLSIKTVTKKRFCEDTKALCKSMPTARNIGTRKIVYEDMAQALSDYFEEKCKQAPELSMKRVEAILDNVLASKRPVGSRPRKPTGARVDANAVARAVGGWITKDHLDRNFVERCANDWGNYLLLRMPSQGKLITSEMQVRFDPEIAVFPTFRTIQYRSGRPNKEVNGCIFKSGRGIHAIGRLEDDDLLRVSNLNYRTRPGDRTDMFGVRTGPLAENSRLYSYLIYLYQLSGERQKQVAALRTIDDPSEKFSKVGEILPDSFPKIVEALTPAKPPLDEEGNQIFEFGFQPVKAP